MRTAAWHAVEHATLGLGVWLAMVWIMRLASIEWAIVALAGLALGAVSWAIAHEGPRRLTVFMGAVCALYLSLLLVAAIH